MEGAAACMRQPLSRLRPRRTLSLRNGSSLQTSRGAARRFPRALAQARVRAVGVRPAERLRPRQRLHARRHARAARIPGDRRRPRGYPRRRACGAQRRGGARRPHQRSPDHAARTRFQRHTPAPHRAARRPLRRARVDPGFPHAGMADRRADGHPAPPQGRISCWPTWACSWRATASTSGGSNSCSTCCAMARGAAG